MIESRLRQMEALLNRLSAVMRGQTIAMSSIRSRIERLERKAPRAGVINWDNFWCRREDIVPDGIIDWDAMFERPDWSAEDCPIERAIAEVGNPAASPGSI
jgi:hypothetical protein